ncbi:hypothetical protein IFM89_027695 [Coptis chinensis]|uniref:Cytochrome P450 n=1 Tax=Coptis chinensis TaxID=261450 RepID=A0A835HXR6_9MAGN|nr:hypothetical protein IFM89_027695 [Coptis chinensis]
MNQAVQWLEQQTHSILLYPLLFILSLFVVISLKTSKVSKYRLPPSPTKLPLIGNLHQLHGLPHHAFLSLAKKHGPLMWLHLGLAPTLVVSSANIAQDVMKTYDHVFSSRPQLTFPKRLTYGKDIAFAPYGEYWRQVRKICVLQLLSAKKVQSFRSIREEEIAIVVEKIKESSSSNSVNLSEMFASLLTSITCRVALGRKYNEEEGAGRKFKEMLKEFAYLLAVSNVGDLIPSLAWLNNLNGLSARVEKNFKELDSFLNEVIDERIEKNTTLGAVAGAETAAYFVDVLLGNENDSTLGFSLAREDTKAIILDMFGAGTDTSSVLLEWTMSELLRHPKIMEQVQTEVRDIARGRQIVKEADIEQMQYLKSVVKETLRLHPPVPLLVPRESMEDAKIQGYDIPAKTTVVINVFAIGRDPMLWDDPDKFCPERFLNGSCAKIDLKGQDFQLIPFGAGRRGCPGILFALAVNELALANLLNGFDWALPDGLNGGDLDMHEASGIAIHRKNDLLLTAKPHY